MHFGQIMVKIFFQTRNLEILMSFEPIFLNPKDLNPNKSKLDQALRNITKIESTINVDRYIFRKFDHR